MKNEPSKLSSFLAQSFALDAMFINNIQPLNYWLFVGCEVIKPDGVQRGLVGKIIDRFEKKGFKLVALKLMTPTKELLENHYEDLKPKPFFPGLIKYMMMGPVVCMVLEGDGVVATGRKMLGATKPSDSVPGSIRGDLCVDVGRNIIHGSDSVEAAQKEIALWFPEGINRYNNITEPFVYEKVL